MVRAVQEAISKIKRRGFLDAADHFRWRRLPQLSSTLEWDQPDWERNTCLLPPIPLAPIRKGRIPLCRWQRVGETLKQERAFIHPA